MDKGIKTKWNVEHFAELFAIFLEFSKIFSRFLMKELFIPNESYTQNTFFNFVFMKRYFLY